MSYIQTFTLRKKNKYSAAKVCTLYKVLEYRVLRSSARALREDRNARQHVTRLRLPSAHPTPHGAPGTYSFAHLKVRSGADVFAGVLATRLNHAYVAL